MLPVLNTIKSHWPHTNITWIIGKTEHGLVGNIPGIRWAVFDKSLNFRAYKDVKRQLAGQKFDLLLLMQLSFRANLIPILSCVCPERLGFDRARSRDLHSLAVNRHIPPRRNEHVLDSFFGFTDALNMPRRLVWDRCYSENDTAFARQHTGDKPSLLISPCSSHPLRNWSPARYARVAEHAYTRHGLQPVLTGGSADRHYANLIIRACAVPVINLVGKTSLCQLAALIACSRVVLSPDSGPAHLATCVNTPVICLFAATNPDRATPYLSRQWCVNRYPDAARIWLKRDSNALPWGTKIERPGVMNLITVDEVTTMLDKLIRDTGECPQTSARPPRQGTAARDNTHPNPPQHIFEQHANNTREQ